MGWSDYRNKTFLGRYVFQSLHRVSILLLQRLLLVNGYLHIYILLNLFVVSVDGYLQYLSLVIHTTDMKFNQDTTVTRLKIVIL
jgi:hypothetical protein